MKDVHLVEVEPDAAFLILQEGVVLPAVPQARHHVMKLRGAVVADTVLEMLVAAEVHGLVLGLRGDEIPAGAAAADVIDGEEAAGDVVRLVVGSRAGRDETDAAGDGAQSRVRADRFDVRLAAVLLAEDLAAIDRSAA